MEEKESHENEERREEFIDAAERLFKKNGVMGTTINAIVDEMNVAKGLFYYYFKSKDDVIDAISEKYNESFRQSIRKNLSRNDSFEERLDQFLDNTIASFRQMCENLQGASKDIDLSILSSRSLDEAKETASEALKDLLEEGNRLHKLHVDNAEYFSKVMISGIADLCSQAEADGKEIRRVIEDLIRRSGKE